MANTVCDSESSTWSTLRVDESITGMIFALLITTNLISKPKCPYSLLSHLNKLFPLCMVFALTLHSAGVCAASITLNCILSLWVPQFRAYQSWVIVTFK